MYAIVQTGGKQYKVQPGDIIEVERLPAEPGEELDLGRVLMVGGGEENAAVGNPQLAGARVVAEVLDQTKDKKIVVFKFKAKSRYRRKTGHRQSITRVRIREILGE